MRVMPDVNLRLSMGCRALASPSPSMDGELILDDISFCVPGVYVGLCPWVSFMGSLACHG